MPFHHKENNLNINNQLWSEIKGIGHRGYGASRQSFVAENTLLSFLSAHKLGIKFVEFDVQLTSDHTPVIYHNWTVSTEKNITLSTPLAHLSLQQFKKLNARDENRQLNQRFSPWTKTSNTTLDDGDILYGETAPSPMTQRLRQWIVSDASFPTLKEVVLFTIIVILSELTLSLIHI
eukprot:TRINITY_DN1833_c0_g2_i1.p1 TRINITY_DN1833_c0_g2~~TRINITY_DN1833_c0_g2_i1.p1  ORF type:complete len:177 (-),score=24.91 TRINITY_DN1833_c0_g2_i1:21-551(-)